MNVGAAVTVNAPSSVDAPPVVVTVTSRGGNVAPEATLIVADHGAAVPVTGTESIPVPVKDRVPPDKLDPPKDTMLVAP